MSLATDKISRETLFQSVEQLLNDANVHRQRKFLETVESQIILKHYDTNREKRFSGLIRLPFVIRPRFRVCLYGDEKHCDEARVNGIPCLSVEDLKKLNKDRRKIQMLEHRFDAFLASETIIRQIPRLMGPRLGRMGKFPTLVTHDESLAERVLQMKSTLRVYLKKQAIINVPIGHVQMTIDQLISHLTISMRFIILRLLRKKWQNIFQVMLELMTSVEGRKEEEKVTTVDRDKHIQP